jgi:large subunit ribosomal protein L10
MDARGAGFVAAPAAVAGRTSFCGTAVCTRQASTYAPARVHMRSAVNLQKKVDKVAAVREDISVAESVFQVPLSGISVKQISELKRELPAGSTCRTVKNTLMKRAIEGTPWSVVGDLCQESTVWFFVNDDLKATVAAYNKWAKTHKREGILGGAMDGTAYDAGGMKMVADLPSKQELYGQIAMLLKTVPTKLARSINQVPTKVGRAINLAINNPKEAAGSE